MSSLSQCVLPMVTPPPKCISSEKLMDVHYYKGKNSRLHFFALCKPRCIYMRFVAFVEIIITQIKIFIFKHKKYKLNNLLF